MSRDLGRVEKKILEFLNDEEITKDMRREYRYVCEIVEYVYYETHILKKRIDKILKKQ